MTGLKVKSPCKACEDRCVGCHSTCRKYDFYRARVAYVRHKIIECDMKRVDNLKQTLIFKDNHRRYISNPANRKNYIIGGSV